MNQITNEENQGIYFIEKVLEGKLSLLQKRYIVDVGKVEKLSIYMRLIKRKLFKNVRCYGLSLQMNSG